MQNTTIFLFVSCIIFLSNVPLFAGYSLAAEIGSQNGGEVKEALTDLRHFKDIAKFPGLTYFERLKFRENFMPEVKNIEINQDAAVNLRLAALAKRVFVAHDLTKQCEPIVVESPIPTVLTWKLTFFVITTGALKILNDEEIIALFAHEAGHLYYVEQLRTARDTNDSRLARIIELKADAVALETLDSLKIPHANLLSALTKLIETRTKYGIKSFTEMSPKMETRLSLAEEYQRRAAAGTLFLWNSVRKKDSRLN